MLKPATHISTLALIAILALSSVPTRLFGQPANAGRGQAAPGGRGGRGRGSAIPDPSVNQFRTIDGVKYVDGEAQLPNSQPNLYREVPNWPQLPAGRKLGAISGIAAGPDGNIWVADRCTTGIASCGDSDLAPVFEFDPSGKML